MAKKKMTFVRLADAPFRRTAEFLDSEAYDEAAAKDPETHNYSDTIDGRRDGVDGTEVRIYFPGSPDELQLFEVRLEPNLRVGSHAHVEDEIMYVTGGQMSFGSQTCKAGDAVVIPGGTLYSIEVGPEGCTFLNFRAREDFSRIPKDKFMEMRAGSAS